MHFRSIGQFDIRRDGDVLVVWSTPSFNRESALEYAAAMREILSVMPDRWGVLARFDDLPVLGPDVEHAMRTTSVERAARGMRAAAFVLQPHACLDLARQQWLRIYDGLSIAFELFFDETAARAWLRRSLDD